jgi:hypothetical protein
VNMLDHKIKEYISISVTGRVFVFCTKEGIKNTALIRKYEKQVRDFLEQKANEGADIKTLEQLTVDRLEILRREIHGELMPEPEPQKPKENRQVKVQPEEVVEQPEKTNTRNPAASGETASKPAVTSKKQPEVASYQEKLSFHRKPVVELLKKECVDFHLLSSDRAKYWVHHLSGRYIEDIEPDIVNELSDALLKNVRTYMSKNKKEHPWQTPMAQEQVRMDIAATKTVKGILTLTSQILWEIRKTSKAANSGLLGRIRSKLPW